MLSPKYTGFYKPGMKVKAAEMSLRPTDDDSQKSAPPESAPIREGYIQLIQRAERRVEPDSRPIAA